MHWFKKCNFWKKSLNPFRGRWGQEVIFEVAEAKFWISPNFYRFSLENFCCFEFRGCLTSATSLTSETPGWKISIHGNFEPLGCTLSPCSSRLLGLWLFVLLRCICGFMDSYSTKNLERDLMSTLRGDR